MFTYLQRQTNVLIYLDIFLDSLLKMRKIQMSLVGVRGSNHL